MSFRPQILTIVAAVLFSACLAQAGELVAVDKAQFGKLFPADAKVQTLAKDLKFTEGPVWVGPGDKGYLVFSDIPANKLYRWDKGGGLKVFREPSEQTNGNTLDNEGRLISCQHWARRVVMTKKDGSIVVLTETYNGKKFNSPNDAVVKSDGTIWFTDPDYGLRGRPKEQPGNYVYRFNPADGTVKTVATDFVKPNGLCFSPDEKLLYIADSGTPKHIRVFDVTNVGGLENGRVFCKLDKGGPDGIRCDKQGRVWSSSGDGAQIFSPKGKLLARVVLPKGGANLCFGGERGMTLYITARDGLYSVETLTTDAKKK